ncbi:helix-turn-helix domain-containing protein [Rhizobium sp. BK176]|uniref:helix-turn-helix domain-containing protein n=1 Tax=Rhizobium sp. BK176 TaxID=2587071 RepID=UPI0021675330|nr:helix-turn-helix domain-containing protein [Rhizobium sp. BK176]MCS4089397.1 transposase [Rhizobium sp. BK176]
MANSHIDVIEFNQAELKARAAGATGAVRRRVEALIAVAKGQDPREVAERIGAERANVLRWVRAFNDGGYEALSEIRVGRSTAMRSDFDAEKLRKIANDAVLPETKNRLLAIASMYDGMTTAAISVDTGISEAVIRRWRANFNENGPGVKSVVTTAAKLEADLAVTQRTDIKTVADIIGKLTGEQREKAEAILMSAQSMSVARICEALGRPRNWTVSVIRTFNSTGTETLFGVQNRTARAAAGGRSASIELPEGHTVKSLSDAARQVEGRASRDLYALSKVYLYKNRREAAEASGVAEARIGLLLARLQKGGIKAVLEQPAYMELDADKVVQVAQGYKDKKAAAKLFALARVIRGESFEAVAADTGGDKARLRELMNRLVRFGPDGVPDAYHVRAVPEKPKSKTPPPAIPTASKVAKATFSARVRKAVEKEKREAARKSRVPSRYFEGVPAETAPVEVKASSPFVSPSHMEFVKFMASDAGYAGRNLASAMLEYVETGNAEEAARRFGVAESSVHLLSNNLGPTVELYAENRVRTILDEAGITIAKVKRLSRNCPNGWMSKLRSIGYLAERRSLREVSAITNVGMDKLLRWTAEIARGWEAAEERLTTTVQPRRVAGMGR